MDGTPAFGGLNYCILGIYMVVMFGIGLKCAGKQKTTENYFLAGRNMPWFVVAMSMFASLTSATAYLGVPGSAYSENISILLVGVVSVIVAPFLILLFYLIFKITYSI